MLLLALPASLTAQQAPPPPQDAGSQTEKTYTGAVVSSSLSSTNAEPTIQLEPFNVTGTNIRGVDEQKVLPVVAMNQSYLNALDASTPVDLVSSMPMMPTPALAIWPRRRS